MDYLNWNVQAVPQGMDHIPCAKYADLLEYHHGVGGTGDHAYNWSDKPHRLVYDLTHMATQYRDEIDRLRAENEALLEVLAPFAHFALVRAGLGSMAPKGDGVVYAVHSSAGEAELTANDFEAAFDAIARNTEEE